MKSLLAIDPGTTESAIVVWDGDTVLYKGKVPNAELIKIISNQPESEHVACEHFQCFGMAVGKEVFETAYLIGRLQQICLDRKVNWIRVFRSEVKMHHCHSMRATDSNIRTALCDRFGLPGKKKTPGLTYGISGDIWSAFAIATMVFDNQRKSLSRATD